MGLLSDDLNFTPSLGSSNSAYIPSILLPSAQLRWQVALSREHFSEYLKEGYQLQVWSNAESPSSWSEIPLLERTPLVGQKDEGHVDFSVGEPYVLAPQDEDNVILEAMAPALQLSQRTVEFTYRLLDHNGSILHWYGSPESNGQIIIRGLGEEPLSAEWTESATDGRLSMQLSNENGVRIFNVESSPRFAWGLTTEGHIFSNLKLASDKLFKFFVILPSTGASSMITYYPALYTAESGHFSLQYQENHCILKVHGTQPNIYASIDKSTWNKQITIKDTRILDIPEPNVLIAVQNSSVPRIHFLPIGAAPTSLSLDTNHISAYLKEISAALVQAHSGKYILLQQRSPDRPIQIAVGATGGEILLSLVHTFEEWKVIFVPVGVEDIGLEVLPSSTLGQSPSTAPDEKSSQTTLFENNHQDPIATAYLFALAIQFLHILFNLLPTTQKSTFKAPEYPTSPSSSSKEFTSLSEVVAEKSPSKLTVKANNELSIIFHGSDDISKVALYIEGNPSDISAIHVEEAWLYNVTKEDTKCEPGHTFEIAIMKVL
ncbi:hypothetical protein M422DRAFT_29679 [Sphaerobolus stellatus SS14]|uniref:Uncharacterized protein n=1 Tax=Sphaerobolus stellatus (strain SS14) TaxID=990650 RepID=A0A0C9VSR6_SPHS4|nr:hypothetical protein M422DRAFT_29679 [Sphaerobolus stellatus SS14]